MSIDDLIEKFRPQPPEEFDWHEGHVRAVAGAARRELARELLAMPGYDDDLIMRLTEIAEEEE